MTESKRVLAVAIAAAVSLLTMLSPSAAIAGSTQICSSDPSNGSCPGGSAITQVHLVDPLGLVFVSALFGIHADFLCEILFSGTVLGLGAPQVIHGNFTFSGPHGVGSNCIKMKTEEGGEEEVCAEVKEVSNGGLLKVLRTGNEIGEVVSEGFRVLVQCGGIHCVHNFGGVKFSFSGALGGGNGSISARNSVIPKEEGFLCPSKAELTTTLVSLTAIYAGV